MIVRKVETTGTPCNGAAAAAAASHEGGCLRCCCCPAGREDVTGRRGSSLSSYCLVRYRNSRPPQLTAGLRLLLLLLLLLLLVSLVSLSVLLSFDMAAADVEFRCFVGGLAWATDDESLRVAFQPYGDIVDSKVWWSFWPPPPPSVLCLPAGTVRFCFLCLPAGTVRICVLCLPAGTVRFTYERDRN